MVLLPPVLLLMLAAQWLLRWHSWRAAGRGLVVGGIATRSTSSKSLSAEDNEE